MNPTAIPEEKNPTIPSPQMEEEPIPEEDHSPDLEKKQPTDKNKPSIEI